MRRAWLGVFAVMVVGVPLSACGSPFESVDADAGTGDDTGTGDDAGGDEGVPLPANDGDIPDTSTAHEGGDAHHDAMADNDAPDMGMTVDSGTPDTSMPDTSTPDTSTPDTGPVLDACTLDVADESVGVFVSPGGPTSGCGSKAVPCGTFQAAYAVATTAGKNVIFVNQGTYTESVTLVSNISIRGGWVDVGGNWTRNCTPGNAANYTIKAPAGSNKTIIANNVTGVTIDTISVASKDANSVAAGESIYGIFATGSTSLSLVNVDVSVVAGGVGGSGGAGGAGTNGSGTCTPASDGAAGGAGAGGSSGPAGSFGASGYTPATGGVGGTGATGHNGTLTAPATDFSGGCDANEDGSCAGTISVGAAVSGAVGVPGCPGTGATGGAGGSGGGSSIALFVWGASVTMSVGALASGDGATGGTGGAGGSVVGLGSAGTTGASALGAPQTCTTHAHGTGGNITYTCGGTNRLVLAGGVGGTGGAGGAGGQGGGGAGGFSYSYYVGGGGAVTPNGTMLTYGITGAGGSGGNTGSVGGAGPHN